jgi:hypothetical protein
MTLILSLPRAERAQRIDSLKSPRPVLANPRHTSAKLQPNTAKFAVKSANVIFQKQMLLKTSIVSKPVASLHCLVPALPKAVLKSLPEYS